MSTEIIETNVRIRLVWFVETLCGLSLKMFTTKEKESLRKRLLNRESPKVNELMGLPFVQIPDWIFTNHASTVYRNVITINGYSFDVTKSAMQKYARRGMPVECMYSMVEMYFFKWIPSGKGSFTNFVNRIRVILLEDVGVASPHAIPLANNLIKELRNANNLSSALPKLAWLVSNSLHGRLFSFVRRYYKNNIPQPTQAESHFPLRGSDEVNFRTFVDSLVGCMERKDKASVWWVIQIHEDEKKLEQKCYRRTKAGFLGFAVVEWFLKKNNAHPLIIKNFDICLEWYMDLTIVESVICLFHPVFLYILRDKLNFDMETYQLNGETHTLWQPNLLNQKLEFIRAVYDKHTKIGKKLGRDLSDFVAEGSLTAFEDSRIEFAKGRELYNQTTAEQGIIRSEKNVFVLKARAQLTCSQSRPDVYFATEDGKNVVVKGPFLDYQSAVSAFQVSRLLSLFDKVNTLPTNLRLLNADMFESVPVGCRQRVESDTSYYFLVFDDLYDLDSYPTITKSSKLWDEEEVVNFDTLFDQQGGNIGFAVPSEMSENACLSLLYQLAIRYTFELGDFASRNFTRVGDVVWNLDTDGMFVGKSLRWKESERKLLAKVYENHREDVNKVLKGWLSPVSESNPSLYDRWFMVQRTMGLTDEQLVTAKSNLKRLIGGYGEWLIQP